jgi:hypothetical protein
VTPTRNNKRFLLFMVTISGLTAQADVVRTLEKVIPLLQSFKRPKDIANPPSSVAGVCATEKERSYF